MKKELPFISNPSMVSYPFYGCFLGILEACNIDASTLMFNHYLTLFYGMQLHYLFIWGGFVAGGALRKLFCTEKVETLGDNPISFVKCCVDQNKYLTIVMNAKYIKPEYYTKDWLHEWMVYGYDDEANAFLVVGYARQSSDTTTIRFHEAQVSYENFVLALPSKKVATGLNGLMDKIFHISVGFDYYMNSTLYWLSPQVKVEKINIPRIRRNIFLYAHNVLPFMFNARIYLIYIKHMKAHRDSSFCFDLRSFRTLLEHKQIMLSLLQHLAPFEDFTKDYEEIFWAAKSILYIALKYNVAKDFSVVRKKTATDKICFYFQKLHDKERYILMRAYAYLKNQK